MSIVRVRFLEDGREAEIPLDILSFKAPKKLTKEEWKKLAEQYKGRPLPPEYYADFKPGKLAFIQWHIRGILPEDKEAYDKGKKSFSEIIVGHSLHQDFRMWFQGLSKPVEWVILDDSMEAYERYNLGKRDPKTGNVQKSLAVVKEAEALKEKATKKAQDKLLISEKDTKIIEKYALHEYDNWLPPGDVGCLDGETWVLTETGWEKIKYLKPGDKVLTHKGRFKKVKRVMYKGRIKAKTTLIHPVGYWGNIKFYSHKILTKDGWKHDAEITESDKLVTPKAQWETKDIDYLELEIPPGYRKHVKVDKDFCQWIGFFVGDGSITNTAKGLIELSCADEAEANKYAELTRKVFGINGISFVKDKRTKSNINLKFYDRGLAKFLADNCYNKRRGGRGKKAFKQFPVWFVYLPSEKLKAAIDGFLEADRAYCEGNRKSIGNTSPYALGQVYLMLLKLQRFARISYKKNEKPNHNAFFVLTWLGQRIRKLREVEEYEDSYYVSIRNITTRWAPIELYDIEVEDDHTFVAGNIIVSNSTPYAWGVLVTISIGVAQPGVQRQSLHEYFYYPSKDLPKRNQKLMNGRIIFRAFKKPRPLWWTWMAIRDPRPYNPYCFDSETEIYTKNGWKSVDTIKRSDLVASLNPKTLEWEWSGIKQIIKFNYSGTAYLFESRDISLLAHPNHMQPLFVDYKSAISFVSAQEYSPKYCWWFLRGANWRKQDNNIMWIGNKAYPKRNLCELIGWILGDGYLTKPAGEKHYYIGIRQEKQTNLNIIYQLAKATTRKVRKYKDRVVIRDHVLADFLAKEIGSVAGERRVPEFIRESSAENIQAFLYGLLGSDGHFRNRSKEPEGWGERIFYTSSASLAGSLAELILKAGGSVSYYLDCRKGKICFDKYIEKTDSYHIRWKKSTTTLSRWVEKKEVFYNGIMWDVELEKNHILLVRRHGRVFWTGNCGIDQGVYHLTPAEDLKYINKEDYPEWKNRKEDCE